jgi:hypothetical protein
MNNSFEAWLEIHRNDYFRYWVHKIMFTPYEEELKDELQSCYDCDDCNYGYIVEYSILPDNDILLGLSESRNGDYINYYKLSAIDLALSDTDNKEE